MSEYTNVEHPFLEKLREIGWQVIDKGSGGIPQDPAESMRTSFSEVVLKEELFKKLGELNPWITAEQKEYCYRKIADIDAAMNELNTAFHAVSQEMYNAANAQGAQAGPNAGQQQSQGGNAGDNVQDADFEEVK